VQLVILLLLCFCPVVCNNFSGFNLSDIFVRHYPPPFLNEYMYIYSSYYHRAAALHSKNQRHQPYTTELMSLVVIAYLFSFLFDIKNKYSVLPFVPVMGDFSIAWTLNLRVSASANTR